MKIKRWFAIGLVVISMMTPGLVMAQSGTVLPKVDISGKSDDCDFIITQFNLIGGFKAETEGGGETSITEDPAQLIACGIQTGRISLAMVPIFIQFFSNYLLGLVSLVAVLFIVIGGLYYAFGPLTANKDKGKNFIKHAIMGMVLAFLAWSIVTVIIAVVTS